MNEQKKPKREHIRHTIYYKTTEEKKMVEQYAEDKDMTASKVIYRLLKESVIFRDKNAK